MRLTVLRHGPTAWNRQRRLQGRRDVPLDAPGRAYVSGLRLPVRLAALPCFSSPLARAIETAELLRWTQPEIEPRLTEMDWGRFEGRTLDTLRRSLGAAMAENEARGLDFRPDGGESPRDVVERLSSLFESWRRAPADRAVITHKGVRRAMLAMATGWDMRTKPPIRLRDDEALLLDLDLHGGCGVVGVTSLS
ncbi:MAG: histidine phosphatase family protein [Geminicoccaceae bacterium]|nr:histidine phosphatase family protein [Geminicoccaceae bacterium]